MPGVRISISWNVGDCIMKDISYSCASPVMDISDWVTFHVAIQGSRSPPSCGSTFLLVFRPLSIKTINGENDCGRGYIHFVTTLSQKYRPRHFCPNANGQNTVTCPYLISLSPDSSPQHGENNGNYLTAVYEHETQSMAG